MKPLFSIFFLPTLALAFALPPKVRDLDYAGIATRSTERRAREVYSVSKDSVPHAAFVYVPTTNKILWLSDDASQISTVQLAAYTPQAVTRAATEKDLSLFWKPVTSVPYSGARLELAASKIYLKNGAQELWSLNLGYEPTGVEAGHGSTLMMGWELSPSKIFVLRPDRLSQILLPKEFEPVRLQACDSSRIALASNLPSGLVRLDLFRAMPSGDLQPAGTTLFDFSGNERASDLTAMAAISCDEFYFAGTFGVVRVRY